MNPSLRMVGGLGPCVLVSLRTPAESVAHLLPRGLELVRQGEWAFWNIVIARVRSMRPTAIPEALGMTYHHVAYRLLVRAPLARGGALTGLYFVRSDADNRLIATTGNALTAFRFHYARVRLEEDEAGVEAKVSAPDAALQFRARFAEQRLASGSCFASVEERTRLLKYRPLGLSLSPDGRRVRVAQVVRDESLWREEPLQVEEANWEFLHGLGQDQTALEQATAVHPMPYAWQLGRQALLAATRY